METQVRQTEPARVAPINWKASFYQSQDDLFRADYQMSQWRKRCLLAERDTRCMFWIGMGCIVVNVLTALFVAWKW